MRILMFAVITCVASMTPGEIPGSGRWLSYEPAVVQLAGTLRVVPEFGPPNFGEDPETDKRVQIPILVLSDPINVKENAARNVDYEALENVSEIQLVFSTRDRPAYSHLVGHTVVVTGKLFHAQTAHHYTPLLMDVEAIRRGTK